MPSTMRDLKDAVRERLRTSGLHADDKSRIALFIQSVKTANALMLAKVETQALHWWAYQLLHDQYFKEVELATLLGRTIPWTLNPSVYTDAARINLMLWRDADITRHIVSPIRMDRGFFEYLALSHAFMADIRFMPLFPVEWDFTEPFLYAIHEIEDENGRQIQAQIRLLKDMDAPSITPAERENIVGRQRAIVDRVFAEFLRTLGPAG